VAEYQVTSPTDRRNTANIPAPEPERALTLDELQREQVNVAADSLVPGQDNILSTPGPTHPQMAAELDEARAQYARAIEAVGQRDRELEAIRTQMEEVRIQMELLASQPPMQHSGPPQLPPNLDPNATVTVNDLFNFAQDFARQQQMQMELLEVNRIRSGWGITPTQESEILQRFPQIANLPELQKVQAIQKVGQTLYRSKPTVASAPERPPIAAQPLSSQPVPMVESARPLVRDERPDANLLAAAWQEYEAAKKVVNPRERAQRMREGAEKIARLQGTTLDDVTGSQWVGRG